jgi:endonuclease YncB( thermonuclease family)
MAPLSEIFFPSRSFTQWLFLLFGVLASALSYAEIIDGKVVGVSDGDTITVLDSRKVQYKVRLAGIDAPEKSQAFGNNSKQNLSALIYKKTVKIEWHKKDRYGRTIGKVFLGSHDVSLIQVRAGMAWHYKQYEREQSKKDREEYAQAEVNARNAHIGLWRDAMPIPPWNYRHPDRSVERSLTNVENSDCPCGGAHLCTGPRGGQYCVTLTGKKRY